VFGPEGGDVVKIHQDASVYVASLAPGSEVTHALGGGRGAYVYLIDGAASFGNSDLATGDAAKVTDERNLRIRATEQSEVILVDVPMKFEAVGIWADRI
jgi:redox-sensitive bicupin YhaK (pirin superfamily)